MKKKAMFIVCAVALIVIVGVWYGLPLKKHYSSDAKSQNKVLFQPELTKNQVAGITDHFSLNVGGGEKETLKVNIVNTADTPITLYATPMDCVDSISGGVEFEPDSSPIAQMVSSDYRIGHFMKIDDSLVTIAGNSSKEVSIELVVPKHTGGTYLGAVGFADNKTKQVKYAMSVQLNYPKTSTDLEITSAHLIPQHGTFVLFHNNGQKAVAIKSWNFQVTSPQHPMASKEAQGGFLIQPGASMSMMLDKATNSDKDAIVHVVAKDSAGGTYDLHSTVPYEK